MDDIVPKLSLEDLAALLEKKEAKQVGSRRKMVRKNPNRDLVEAMYGTIKNLRDKKYSFEEISKFLTDYGYPISKINLQLYYRKKATDLGDATPRTRRTPEPKVDPVTGEIKRPGRKKAVATA